MSVFREIYSQTSRFVYHENEILIDMHCPKSFVGIGKNAWRNKNNFLLWRVKNMIGRIFSISFLIFSILLMVIARTYFGKK